MNEYIITPSPIPDNKTFSLLMCGISYPDKSYYVKRACSDLFNIEYVIKGEGTVIENDKKFNVRKGDIYILRQGCKHEYYTSQNNLWEKIWLNAKGSLIDYLLTVYNLNEIVVIHDIDISGFLKKILYINGVCEIISVNSAFAIEIL